MGALKNGTFSIVAFTTSWPSHSCEKAPNSTTSSGGPWSNFRSTLFVEQIKEKGISYSRSNKSKQLNQHKPPKPRPPPPLPAPPRNPPPRPPPPRPPPRPPRKLIAYRLLLIDHTIVQLNLSLSTITGHPAVELLKKRDSKNVCLCLHET